MITQARSRSAVRNAYDRLSRWYDLFSGAEARVSEEALNLLAPRPGQRVLEVGFGTGRILAALGHQVVPGGMVAGLDLSPGMVRMARAHLGKRKQGAPVHLTLADAVALPYCAASYDCLFSAFTLELFAEAEIPHVLEEYRRVLRSAGRLAVVSLLQPPTPCRAVTIYTWFHQRLPDLVDCRPIPLVDLVGRAGFVPTSTLTRSIWGLPVAIVIALKA